VRARFAPLKGGVPAVARSVVLRRRYSVETRRRAAAATAFADTVRILRLDTSCRRGGVGGGGTVRVQKLVLKFSA